MATRPSLGNPVAVAPTPGGGHNLPMASVIQWLRDQEPKEPPLLLLLGEERRLAWRAVDRLRAALEGMDDLAYLRLDAAEVEPAEVVGHCQSLPMLSPRLVVVVEGVAAWLPQQRDEDEEEVKPGRPAADPIDPLLAYLKDPNPTTTLALVADKLDGRARLTKALKKFCLCLECTAVGRGDATTWCRAMAGEAGVRLGGGVAELLVELLGTDLSRLETEVQRLALAVEEGGTVEMATAEAVSAAALPDAWAFIGHLAARDRAKALTTLHDLIAGGEAPIRLLGLIAWQLRQLLRARAGLDRGRSRQQLAKELRLYGNRANQLFQRAARFTEGDLLTAHTRLLQADQELKGRGLDDRLTLEAFVHDLCG